MDWDSQGRFSGRGGKPSLEPIARLDIWMELPPPRFL